MEFAGDGDTSVCISAAKLPCEAGGKEDMGKKRATRGGWRYEAREMREGESITGCERKNGEMGGRPGESWGGLVTARGKATTTAGSGDDSSSKC